MFKRRFKLLFKVLLALVVLFFLFLLEERIRGQISLARYKRELISKGEKLSAKDMMTPISGENGAPEVFKAIKELKEGTVLPKHYPPQRAIVPSGRAVIGFRENEWIDEEVTNNWGNLAADLHTNKAVLEQICPALDKPVLNNQLDFTLGFKMDFMHEAPAKSLVHWFGASSQLALHNGLTHKAVDDLTRQIRLPRLLAEDRIAISELVRIAIAAIANTAVWEALQAEGWTDDDLAKIQEAVQSQDFAGAMAHCLEGERIFDDVSYDMLRKSNEETANMIGRFWTVDTDAERTHSQNLMELLHKHVYCRIWRFAWSHQDQRHSLSEYQHLTEIARTAAKEKSYISVQPAIEKFAAKSSNRNWYEALRYTQSALGLSRVTYRAMRAETERSMTICAVALKRYSLRHGKLPPALNSLVPDFLAAVPTDYMDGQPMKYHLNTEGSFTLYSAGENGKDDGGDSNLLPEHQYSSSLWDRKDFIWPAPALPDEVTTWRKGAAKN